MKKLIVALLLTSTVILSACATQSSHSVSTDAKPKQEVEQTLLSIAERQVFTVVEIKVKDDIQFLNLEDDQGQAYVTFIQLAKDKYVDVKEKDKVSLIVIDTIEGPKANILLATGIMKFN